MSSATSGVNDLIRVVLKTTGRFVEAFADALRTGLDDDQAVVGEWEDAPDQWTVDAYCEGHPDLAPARNQVDRVASALGIAAPEITLEEIAEKDWVAESQAALHPIPAGRFFLHGSHDRAARRAGCHNIEIDAGQAFGTGHHGTTLGCLIALTNVLKGIAPRRMLDVGCGTGVLAIAAALHRKRMVVATDIDPVAIKVTLENARKNAVSQTLRTVVAAGLDHPAIQASGPYDLILANILAGPLKRLAPGIRRAARPGARVILSGLLPTQEARILSAYRDQGFVFETRYRISGWSTLVVRRPD